MHKIYDMKELVGNPYLTQVTVENEQQRIFVSKLQLADPADETLWRNAMEEEKEDWEKEYENNLI